ncbi:MAG: hypothetical protein L6R40_006832 [Gallowayella cf. fulva]|nr:MAG: hypothetical protein L6R40_006832 [Xanthomendoza cf. fulva]
MNLSFQTAEDPNPFTLFRPFPTSSPSSPNAIASSNPPTSATPYFASNGMASIPWTCLRGAAYRGDIALAETFFQRDPDCFNATEPRPAIGPVQRDGHQQFNIAIRNDQFEYIDFMLAHGGDINAGFDRGNDLLKMVVRCAAEDEVTMKRVRFLASRGVKVRESGALREVVQGGSVELTECLLDCGADVNGAMGPRGESPLIIAANEGYEDMVQVLLHLGADVNAVDGDGRKAVAVAKEKGHIGVERILNLHPAKSTDRW